MTKPDRDEERVGGMTTLEQRIEAAARAIARQHGVDPDQLGPGLSPWSDPETGLGHILTDHRRPLWTMWIVDAKAALAAAFPELFTDPPSIAPNEFTEQDIRRFLWASLYAHLNPNRSEGGGE